MMALVPAAASAYGALASSYPALANPYVAAGAGLAARHLVQSGAKYLARGAGNLGKRAFSSLGRTLRSAKRPRFSARPSAKRVARRYQNLGKYAYRRSRFRRKRRTRRSRKSRRRLHRKGRCCNF